LTSLWSGCVEAAVADYPQMVHGKTEAFTILPGLAFRLTELGTSEPFWGNSRG